MNKDILKKIAIGLNEIGVTWGIGGSMMLNHYSLIKKPNDIDILIDASYSSKVKMFMDTIGKYIELPSKEPFKTRSFFGYIVDDVMVEFLGDFRIDLGNDGIYEFILDEESTKDYTIIDGVKVNLTCLEDWFVAYNVMEDPKKRVPLIMDYFNKNGIKNKALLKRNLSNNIPYDIKLDIKSML